jgi:hypothetical protein
MWFYFHSCCEKMCGGADQSCHCSGNETFASSTAAYNDSVLSRAALGH